MSTEHQHYIVIEDPENQYYEGSLVDPQTAIQLKARGVAVLPCEPNLFKLSGAGGYFKRAWGAGWPLDSMHPKMSAQTALFCDTQHRALHWAARLAPTSDEVRELIGTPNGPVGTLRLAADTSQRTPNHAKLLPNGVAVDVRNLGKPDARGGWVVRGKATVSVMTEGVFGFALYGNAPGLRVLWCAVTTTQERNER